MRRGLTALGTLVILLILAGAGTFHAGLVYCHQNTRSIGQVIRALELIWQVYEPDEMKNRIEFI